MTQPTDPKLAAAFAQDPEGILVVNRESIVPPHLTTGEAMTQPTDPKLAAAFAQDPEGVLVVNRESHAAVARRIQMALAELDTNQLHSLERVVNAMLGSTR